MIAIPYLQRIKRILANLSLLLLLVIHAVPATAIPFPPLSFLNIEQGLSNNMVRSIYQDHNGYIWLGTFDGLNRYDGYGFKVYRNKLSDSNSLVSNFIAAITEDSLHNIWIGTRQGVSRLDPLKNNFTTVQYRIGSSQAYQPLNAVVKDIRSDSHNNLYIATEGSGMLICAQATVHAQRIPLVQAGAIITQYSVKLVRIDAMGNAWALVPKYGLARYNPRTQQLELVHTALPQASWLEWEGNKGWIASGTVMYHYDAATNTMTQAIDYKVQYPNIGSIQAFSKDKEQHWWIGTNAGNLITWRPGETCIGKAVTSEEDQAMLNAAGIHAIYTDRQSRKWIGTARGGVGLIDPRKGQFQTIVPIPGNNNSLPGNVVSAILEMPDKKLYMGTDGGGLAIWDQNTNTITALRSEPNDPSTLSDNAITAIKADHTHQVWIATFRRGINRYDPVSKKIEHYQLINPLYNTEDRVTYAMLEDRQHRLWVSTLRQNSLYGSLYLYNAPRNRFEVYDATLSDLFTLYEDKQGNLWGGNLSQLVKIDRQNKHHTYYPIGHAVRSIYEDSNGNLWVGTEGGGLLLFDRSKQAIATRYTTEEGLSSDVVLTILEDEKQQLWMSTFKGLSRMDIQNRSFKNYYQADGLQSNQFHFNSALALSNGQLAFGGIKGMSLFHPAEITGDHTMPPLMLTDITVNNTPIEKKEAYIQQEEKGNIISITVPYSQAVFGFRYTALEYTAASKIMYAYYMDGWDRGWNYTGNIRTATYTHLDEGTYTFRVKSTNGEGEWNPQEIAIHITVLAPWYRSWWAYVLYAAGLLAMIYGYISYKTRQSRLQYEVKEAHLQAKEAQLHVQKEKEINEKRLSFFTNISHEFRTPLTLIIDPVKELLETEKDKEQKEGLKRVYRNARRLLSLVDQLLLFRKAETENDSLRVTALNIGDLSREVFDSFTQQARIKRIDYRLEADKEDCLLYGDREKLEIILFNLLSNAIKYTPLDGRITMKMEEEANTVIIQVIDNGRGIPAETGDKLFNRFYQVKGNAPAKTGFGIGLYLVKHFTTLHHGTIAYSSVPGEGTTFQLTLQKGKAHLQEAEIYEEAQPGLHPTETIEPDSIAAAETKDLSTLITEKPTILLADDDEELRTYLSQVFSKEFNILQATDGSEALTLAQQYLPDLIISDISMPGLGGMDLCRHIKDTPALSHIPLILLTASTATETRLKGIEAGADDYVTKPFEKDLLKARVTSLLKKRNALQQYFYNEITLQKNDGKVSVEYREFLEKCIRIVEEHLDDETFSIKTLAAEMGMSRSSLYRKVNSVSGQSIIGFIRFIRLRKAAELMINTENNVTEIASITGFNDIKYFRTHFHQLFGMNPKEYIQKYRKPFHNNLQLNKNVRKPE